MDVKVLITGNNLKEAVEVPNDWALAGDAKLVMIVKEAIIDIRLNVLLNKLRYNQNVSTPLKQ